MPSDHSTDADTILAARAAQFRTMLQSESRSTTLIQLFDFLLDRAQEHDTRPPKEIEIAMAVFGKSATFDTSQDSLVRGHMHRLRQRLDSFNAESSGARMYIPKGVYRLMLSDDPEDQETEASPLSEPDSPPARRVGGWMFVIVIAIASSLLFWASLLIFGQDSPVQASLGRTALWKPIAAHERMPLIVVGDFYLVSQSGPDGKTRRLAMHPMIQSSRDLDNYLTRHPDQYDKLHDRDIHRVPAVSATGAASILSLVSAMRSDRGVPDIVPVSKVSQERIAFSNIIYIEHFPQLGMLRLPILQMSGFAPGENIDELKDLRSGKLFKVRRTTSAAAPDAPRPVMQTYGHDYGYIAAYSGPLGNPIIVISGLEDTALSQMIKLVSDKREMDLLTERMHGAKAFEALYHIRTVGDLVLDTKLLIARPLTSEPPIAS